MFNTNAIDVLVLSPVILSLIFGFLVSKAENSKRIKPIFSGLLGTALLSTLVVIALYLKTNFSKMSVVVLNGLFEVDHLSAIGATLIITFFLGLYVLSVVDQSRSRRDLQTIDLFNLMALLLALNFSHSIILIFVFSELIFIKALNLENNKINLTDLRGARVRLVGLVLLLGSVAVNYGVGNPTTLSFLRSNAEGLYGADYLFSIGSLFFLAGLVEVFWKKFRVSMDPVGSKYMISGICLLLTVSKYSSGQLFSMFQEAQIAIQWFCVIALIFSSLRACWANTVQDTIRYIFLNTLIMSLAFVLSLVFDGEGSSKIGFVFLISSSVGLLLLSFLERSLTYYKGAGLIVDDLRALKVKLPKTSFMMMMALVLGISFPVGLGFLVILLGFKLTFQTGFYWVGFWSLLSLVSLWTVGLKFQNKIYLQERDAQTWSLWRIQDVKDFSVVTAIMTSILALFLPGLGLLIL